MPGGDCSSWTEPWTGGPQWTVRLRQRRTPAVPAFGRVHAWFNPRLDVNPERPLPVFVGSGAWVSGGRGDDQPAFASANGDRCRVGVAESSDQEGGDDRERGACCGDEDERPPG